MQYYQWFEPLNELADDVDADRAIIANRLIIKEYSKSLRGLRCGVKMEDWDYSSYLEYGHGDLSYDVISTTALGPHVVSTRLKECLEKEAPGEVEFLPIRIQKSDGSGIIEGYFYMNLINHVDCIDMKKTMHKESQRWPGDIDNLGIVHISLKRIPKDRKIFGLRRLPTFTIIREDLFYTFQESGFQGLSISQDMIKISN